jgi:DUF4097 and DUF4098 domain-containing protein YvlB
VIEQTFSVGAEPEIDVRIQSGRVELVEGDPGKVEVRVDTRDPNFVVQQRGDLIEVSPDRDARWMFASSAKVAVTLPPNGRAIVRTASADVDIQVPLRKVEIKTTSGDVTVREAEFAVIKTASGNMGVGRIEDALRSTSASGDLTVREAHGSMVASTASGDIRVGASDATLEINTVSGNVSVDEYRGRQANFKSMSGNIDIGVPTGTKLDLDANLLSGKVNFPPKPSVKPEIKRAMGLKVKSVSGDFNVTRVEG